MEYGIELSSQSIWAVAIVCVLYVITITAFGGYFARFNQKINDFFYSGQRFAWWLPAASMIATGIGSYSYLKYSEQGLNTGMSSSLNYMNDWFIVPFFIFGWLPIVYYAKVKSIPEYFERRFNKLARYIALTIILAYMFFYIGYNLYTIGVAMEGMFQVPIKYSVPIVGIFLGAYVTFGGQTAVIFTDLFQGIMLYFAGGLAIFAGIYALGGFDEFWGWLPVTHRLPFVHLTENFKFNTAGLFWGEALAGSIAFNFMNQGFLMRYLTIKSVDEGRKAAMFNVLFTLPISAIIVGAVGWIGKSLIMKQAALGGAIPGYNLIEIENTFHTFIIICWTTVKHNPWVFGFIIAALMAALMSTIDTLINACAAILIYDLYKPLYKPQANDEHYLVAARWASIISTAVGLLLVVFFHLQASGGKISLMSLHYKGIMVIIPAVVTTIFLGAFWRRFNAPAASAAMIIGSLVTLYTAWGGEYLIEPVSQFVGGPINGKYIYMRALFGMVVTAVVGIIVTYLTQPESKEKIKGLTIDTLDDSIKAYKGGEPNYERGEKIRGLNLVIDNSIGDDVIRVSQAVLDRMKANAGDLIYMEDSRWFLGGLRSNHVKVECGDMEHNMVAMSESTINNAYLLKDQKVTIDKIF
jgi:SSS family solute:Na+ symporter